MKLLQLTILATLWGAAAAGSSSDKQVIITYPQDTPDAVLKEAKDALLAAGAMITHEYELIKGFAVTASAQALNAIHSLSTDFKATIEEDQIYTINDA